MIEFQYAKDRGVTTLDWLKSYHSFSFNEWYDPKRTSFGVLRVLNDDIIVPHKGFGLHAHANMEIVTIVLNGAIEHKDSTGGSGIIKAGDVQRMSAGTGVQHSEFNASSEPVHLLQIWVTPKEKNIAPSYEQQSFRLTKNIFTTVVDGTAKTEKALSMHQDAKFLRGDFEKGEHVTYDLTDQAAYLFIISGNVELQGKTLHAADAAAITNETQLDLTAKAASSLLLIVLPPPRQ